MALAYVAGELVDPDQAVVSVFDHGFVVGDGVFETVLVRAGRPVLLGRHLERLAVSARGLGLAAPEQVEIERAAALVLSAQSVERARLRIIYTSGRGPLGSRRGGGSTLVVLVEPADPPAGSARVVVAPWTRNERGALAGLKTTSYAENARALAFAVEQGADEAVFANTAGYLCEGTGTNVFVVLGDGSVVTPALRSGCLAGVSRSLALECGAVEGDVAIDDFRARTVEEAFLTSTMRGVQPIATIDGAELARCPGPVTASIAAGLEALRSAG
jgi:branched-chain amino acid aminotransferase